MLQILIKIFLSILFIICLFDMPYGYYEIVRFSGMIGFILLAYFSSSQNQLPIVIVYIGLALLFQPLIKIDLGRTLWNVVDIILTIGLIISIFHKPKDI